MELFEKVKTVCVLLFLFSATALDAQEIALTFDDAPTSDGPLYTGMQRAEKIISHLRNKKVDNVAFFVITRNIQANDKGRLKKYTTAGHFLANHTHTHEPIQRLGTANYIKNIQTADKILSKMKGFKPWFRFPFLDEGKTETARDSIRQALKSLGLVNGYVTVDNYDWYINNMLKDAVSKLQKIDTAALRQLYIDHIWKSIEFYDAVSKRTLERSAKHVLLLHENDLAALFLSDLIDFIRSKGWKIVSPEEAYKDEIAARVPNVLFNGQGRIAAIAREKGTPARELVQESEDEEFLQQEAKSRKVFE
jgi:peptidoglycan-N-acetylglucosamine deacetylase